MPNPSATSPSTARASEPLLAASLVLCGLTVYGLSFQHSYWSDGRLYMSWVEHGIWAHYNLAYLPLAHAFHGALGWLSGGDPERPLLWLSAAGAALTAAATYAAVRALGVRVWCALGGALLLMCAPVTWFYATCVELHTLHLLVAALFAWWYARARRDGTLGRSAWPPTLCLVGLFLTHMSGALCAPALSLLGLRGQGRWRSPRHVLIAVPIGLAVLAAWCWLTRKLPPVGEAFALQAAWGVLTRWSPSALWSEIVVPLGPLLIAGIAGWLLSRRSGPLASPPAADSFLIALGLPYLVVVPGFAHAERGAYYIALVPWLALGAALGMERLCATRPRRVAFIAAALLGILCVQAWLARAWVRDWQENYRGAEWVEPLRSQSGNRGCVLVLDAWEREAVRKHTRLDALALRDEGAAASIAQMRATSLYLVGESQRRGSFAAISRSLYESEAGRELIAGLRARCGDPVPGRETRYLVYSLPAAPALLQSE